MIKTTFQEIAIEENGNYKEVNKSFFGRGMSKLPVTNHKLDFIYENHNVHIFYELGNYNLAKIIADFPLQTKIPIFKIKLSFIQKCIQRKMKIHCN